MNYSSIKKLAVTSAVALALFSMPDQANAQTATVATSFNTAVALVAANGTALDFGTWVVDLAGADTPTITIVPVTAGAPALPTPGGVTGATVFTNTVPPATAGSVTIQAPTGADLQAIQIQANITTQFSDPGLTLSAPTFITATETTPTAIPTAFDGTTITAVTGGTPETVGIGGTLTVGPVANEPAAGSSFTDAVITVDFSY